MNRFALRFPLCLVSLALAMSAASAQSQSYLFVWAGGSDGSEFVTTIATRPASET